MPLVSAISLIGGRGAFLVLFVRSEIYFFLGSDIPNCFYFQFFSTFCEIGQCFMRSRTSHPNIAILRANFPPI